jgi:endonuclease III
MSNKLLIKEYIRAIQVALANFSKNPLCSLMYWEWLSDAEKRSLSITEANNFLLGCILDIRASAQDTWENCVFFIEEVLESPENVFAIIAEYTEAEWESELDAYGLHPERFVHMRVHEISRRIMRLYRGDGRLLWELEPATPREVFKRLIMLGFSKTGATMVIGALKDEQYLSGSFDLIADASITRVLSRVLTGTDTLLSANEVIHAGRYLHQSDPWVLDRPFYSIARMACRKKAECTACPLADICVYANEYPFSGDDIMIMVLGTITHQMSLSDWFSKR